MLTAEDAAAGFRLPLPLLQMDGSKSLTLGRPIHCGCAPGSYDAAHPYICGEESTPGCVNTDHIHRAAFTARWIGGGVNCTHYNISVAVHSSLDGKTFDEEPAAMMHLHGSLHMDHGHPSF
eukprot:SAG31_NODE_4229_length_3440_cov_3.033224_6_plen_121_part_00